MMRNIFAREVRTHSASAGLALYGNDGRRIISSMTELEEATRENQRLLTRNLELENENFTLKERLASFEGPSKR